MANTKQLWVLHRQSILIYNKQISFILHQITHGGVANCRARRSEINTPRVFSFSPPFRQETGRKKRGACRQPGSGALRHEAFDLKVKKG
jgi:hypothetical protein